MRPVPGSVGVRLRRVCYRPFFARLGTSARDRGRRTDTGAVGHPIGRSGRRELLRVLGWPGWSHMRATRAHRAIRDAPHHRASSADAREQLSLSLRAGLDCRGLGLSYAAHVIVTAGTTIGAGGACRRRSGRDPRGRGMRGRRRRTRACHLLALQGTGRSSGRNRDARPVTPGGKPALPQLVSTSAA